MMSVNNYPEPTEPQQGLVALFPTPILIVRGALSASEVESARTYVTQSAREINGSSPNLYHTEISTEDMPDCFKAVEAAVLPHVSALLGVLFGQPLDCQISGMWGNLARPGSYQRRHNHANSIISGIVYLTDASESEATNFHKPRSDTSFSLDCSSNGRIQNPFSASTWSLGVVYQGDAVLFPSYLTHDVPLVTSRERITVAFNALPKELNCSGYVIRLS